MTTPTHPIALQIDAVSRRFGAVQALDRVSLELHAGELVALLGPSGCGKTTLLRILGGYERADAGALHLGGQPIDALPPERREIGMVFQSYALFPHLTAQENVEFGLKMRGVARAERRASAAALLQRVGLAADEWSRRPDRLSGGQQQRVALARALVLQPRLLLLDEPFANLDLVLRKRLRRETRDLQRRLHMPTLLVTHDQDEAFELADRIAVMFEGHIAQSGSPQDLYERPDSIRVAEFVGAANLFHLTEASPHPLLQPWVDALHAAPGHALMLRPEHLEPHPDGPLHGRITHTRFGGAEVEVDLDAEVGPLRASWRVGDAPLPAIGDPIALRPTRLPRLLTR